MKKLFPAALAALLVMLCGSPALAQIVTGSVALSDHDPVAINISTATTTQLVAASGFKTIYVSGGMVYAGGTGNITFKAGTGSSCGTGTRSLTGPIPLKDQGGFLLTGGLGNQLRLRAGEALCATTDAAVQMSGWLIYAQR